MGDQEAHALVHNAIKTYPDKYKWVVPWVGNCHLLEHTLDVLFRKWGGLGIIKLAKANGISDKKLESNSYHKRHFVLVAALEAV